MQITFTGLTQGKVLTGQPVTAKLDIGSYSLAQTGTPPATQIPSWGLPDVGVCFGSFQHDTVGKENPVNLNVSSPTFYTKAALGTVNVTCGAQLLLPDNTMPSVTALQVFTSLKPSGTWNIATGGFGFGNNFAIFGLLGNANYMPPRGQDWKAMITAPAPFDNVGGTLAFLQLSDGNREYYSFDNPPKHYTWPPPMYKGEGLDNSFPYLGNTFALKAVSNAGDTPNTGLQSTASVTMTGNYHTWIMFQPTGGEWVPIMRYDWNIDGEADFLNGIWTMPRHTVNAPSMGSAEDKHPTWDHIRPGGLMPVLVTP